MKPTILIVEDEGLIALDLKNRLEKAGYSVPVIADNAADGLRLAGTFLPDVVLMDIGLHGPVDGIETASQIHERFRIPVLYVTSHADPETLDRAKQSKPLGYIFKPFHGVDFRAEIETALWMQKTEQKLRAGGA